MSEERKGGEKLKRLDAALAAADKALGAIDAELGAAEAKIDSMRAAYAGNAEFARYEAYLDDGIDLARLTTEEMRALRCDLQLIFQDPYSSLNPRMTVGQIVGEGMLAHGYFRKNDERMQEEVLRVMDECGLQPVLSAPAIRTEANADSASASASRAASRCGRNSSSATRRSPRSTFRFSRRLSTFCRICASSKT